MSGERFRFQGLDVWRRAAALTPTIFALAAEIDERRSWRIAEQLRASCLSITNNIAEGSGSASKADFANFINIARRSLFEVANMLLILSEEKHLALERCEPLLQELQEISQMLYAFRQSLLRE